jgi:hypothetical protein
MILFALAAMAFGAAFNIGAAQAQNYPFCLKSDAGPGDCKYDTYGQCMAAASGVKGYCQPNYWLQQNNAGIGYGSGYGSDYGRRPRPGRYYGPDY